MIKYLVSHTKTFLEITRITPLGGHIWSIAVETIETDRGPRIAPIEVSVFDMPERQFLDAFCQRLADLEHARWVAIRLRVEITTPERLATLKIGDHPHNYPGVRVSSHNVPDPKHLWFEPGTWRMEDG